MDSSWSLSTINVTSNFDAKSIVRYDLDKMIDERMPLMMLTDSDLLFKVLISKIFCNRG